MQEEEKNEFKQEEQEEQQYETAEEEKKTGVEIYYWESSNHSPAGHVSMKIKTKTDEESVAFYVNEERPTGECAKGLFIDLEQELQLMALRTIVIPIFKDQKPTRTPPTIADVYLELVNTFKLNRESSEDTTEEVNPKVDQAELRQQYLNRLKDKGVVATENSEFEKNLDLIFNTAFTAWQKDTTIFSAEKGKPTHTVRIEFLDNEAMLNSARALKNNPKLKWDSQVGFRTDELLNQGCNVMSIFSRLPKIKGQATFTHHEHGIIRHSCASIVLYILEAGGIFKYTKHFKVIEPSITSIHTMLDVRAEYDPNLKEGKEKTHHDIDSLKTANLLLSIIAFRHQHPFTTLFGVPPKVVYELALCASNNVNKPVKTTEETTSEKTEVETTEETTSEKSENVGRRCLVS